MITLVGILWLTYKGVERFVKRLLFEGECHCFIDTLGVQTGGG